MNALSFITVEPAPVVVRFPAPRTIREADQRRRLLSMLHRMRFEAIREADEEFSPSIHGGELTAKLIIADATKTAARYLAESKRWDEPNPHYKRLLHQEFLLKAEAFQELLYGDLIMFRLCCLEYRRARAEANDEHSRIAAGGVA